MALLVTADGERTLSLPQPFTEPSGLRRSETGAQVPAARSAWKSRKCVFGDSGAPSVMCFAPPHRIKTASNPSKLHFLIPLPAFRHQVINRQSNRAGSAVHLQLFPSPPIATPNPPAIFLIVRLFVLGKQVQRPPRAQGARHYPSSFDAPQQDIDVYEIRCRQVYEVPKNFRRRLDADYRLASTTKTNAGQRSAYKAQLTNQELSVPSQPAQRPHSPVPHHRHVTSATRRAETRRALCAKLENADPHQNNRPSLSGVRFSVAPGLDRFVKRGRLWSGGLFFQSFSQCQIPGVFGVGLDSRLVGPASDLAAMVGHSCPTVAEPGASGGTRLRPTAAREFVTSASRSGRRAASFNIARHGARLLFVRAELLHRAAGRDQSWRRHFMLRGFSPPADSCAMHED